PHYLDVSQWCLGQDAPKGVFALGGKYAIDDNRDIPDTMEVVWEYAGPTLVTLSQFNANATPGNLRSGEIEFRGTKGTLLMNEGSGYEIIPERMRTTELPALSPLHRRADAAPSRATRPASQAQLRHARIIH